MLKCNVYVCKREEAVKGTSSPSLMCHPNRPKYSQTFLMLSPLLSSHLYQKVTLSCPVIENFIRIEPHLRGLLS